MPYGSQGTAEEYARYRAGMCVGCGQQPYSAGRPRCNDCHTIHLRQHVFEPGLKREATPTRRATVRIRRRR